MQKTPQNCKHADQVKFDAVLSRLQKRMSQFMLAHTKLVTGEKEGSMFLALGVDLKRLSRKRLMRKSTTLAALRLCFITCKAPIEDCS